MKCIITCSFSIVLSLSTMSLNTVTCHAQESPTPPSPIMQNGSSSVMDSLPPLVTDADNLRYVDSLLKRVKVTDEYITVGDMLLSASDMRDYRNKLVAKQRGQVAKRQGQIGVVEGGIGVVANSFTNYTEIEVPRSPWPNGVIYYTFDSNVTEPNQIRFIQACHEWEAVANIRFIR